MDYSLLESALMHSWSKETSSDSVNWSKENASLGQCAVTSLIVQDYFGGEIVCANVKLSKEHEISHYYNNISDNKIDFTRIQFSNNIFIPKGNPKTHQFISTREFLLSSYSTKSRYLNLKKFVELYLAVHADIL